MKRINLFLLGLVFVIDSYAQNKMAVAIFNPDDNSNTGFQTVMREMLSTAISKSTRYKAVERALIEKVLEENKYQSTGMVDESKVSELGKQMGADFVCVSMIQKMGSNFFITAKLVNVSSASVEFQEYITTKNGDNDLYEKIGELANKLSSANGTVCSTKESTSNSSLPKITINFQTYLVLPEDLVGTYTWVQAKSTCGDLNAFGYDDWYLPSGHELTALFENRNLIGGFDRYDYWSSTESKINYPIHLFFGDGKQHDDKNLNSSFHVRCIRKE